MLQPRAFGSLKMRRDLGLGLKLLYRKRSSEETDAGTSSTSEDFDKPPWKK